MNITIHVKFDLTNEQRAWLETIADLECSGQYDRVLYYKTLLRNQGVAIALGGYSSKKQIAEFYLSRV